MKINRLRKEPIKIVENIVLSKEQKEAVTTSKEKVLVLAGAGAGKTRVITERIKHLIAKGVEPHSIVAITFTNLASEEVRARLSDVNGIGDAFIGTIHAFANTIMKSSKEKFTIYSSEIENLFYKELIEKYCKYLTYDTYLRYIDHEAQKELGFIFEIGSEDFLRPSEQAELHLISGNNPLDFMNDWEIGEVRKTTILSSNYPETLVTLREKHNVITFNKLLVLATNYFKSINASVDYLIVDEFQDVGTLEYSFLTSLKPRNVFYVGDDYQSIYGFKGGNVKILLGLMESKEYTSYYLSNNYRSAKEILDLAQVIIDQVDNKIEKEVVAQSKVKGKITVKTKADIVDVIADNINKDNSKDWFILTRTNRELEEIRAILEELNLRSVSFKREGLTNDALRELLNSQYVKLLTVHTSKGLESKNVILYGKFPIKQPNYLVREEERKVMYVGITRAKENLIILN